MGLPVPKARLSKALFDRSGEDSRTRTFAWVLQKNSSVPKRVRAISVTSEQHRILGEQSEEFENREHYNWRGFTLGDAKRRLDPNTPLEEIHAVVTLREATESVSTASKVRVTEVYADRRSAEEACARSTSKHPHLTWAVITYPVGKMLF